MHVKYSEAGFPHSGWSYYFCNDLGDVDGKCDICGNSIRYEHILYHNSYGLLTCGCVCSEGLLSLSDYYRAMESEKNIRKKSSKRKASKMKKFNGYDEAKKNANRTPNEKLPKGAYVARILGTKYTEGKDGKSDSLTIQFDIEEGDYKGFFKKQYEANASEDKRYRGQTIIWLPSDDGSERDGWTKNAFAKWPDAIEKSNAGYAWDWDEKKWKNKIIGLVFREYGGVVNGREFVATEVAFPIDAQTVRDGKAPEAKFKARNGYTGASTQPAANPSNAKFVSIADEDLDDLPFS